MYGILTAQLVLSVVIAVVCLSVPQVKGFVQTRYVVRVGVGVGVGDDMPIRGLSTGLKVDSHVVDCHKININLL